MTREQLSALVEMAGAHAELVLVKLRMRELVPTWVLVLPTGAASIVATPWRDDRSKGRMVREIKERIRKLGVVGYSFVCEAWTATVSMEEYGNPDLVRPAQRADRREAVVAIATDGKLKEFRRWEIKRNELELITGLESGPAMGNDSESWLSELMPDLQSGQKP